MTRLPYQRPAPPRTLSIHSPAIPELLGASVLEAERLQGREGINSLFEYELILRTIEGIEAKDHDPANWNLQGFLGESLSCRIALDGCVALPPDRYGNEHEPRSGGGWREINGIVTSAQLWGEDGKQARYRLVLRPWLYRSTLSVTCRNFMGMNVRDILGELLRPEPFALSMQLIESYPNRDYQAQYNETDFAFFERLCQEWGISYHFAHAEGRHTLVLSDSTNLPYCSAEAYHQIRYHAPGWKMQTEYLHKLTRGQCLVSGKYSTDDYDFMQVGANLKFGNGSVYDYGGTHGVVEDWHGGPNPTHYAQPRFPDPERPPGPQRPELVYGPTHRPGPYETTRRDAEFLASIRLQALQAERFRLHASGNLRAMVPGCVFDLVGHPHLPANARHLIIDTSFLIEENRQRSGQAGSAAGQHWKVEVELTAHPAVKPFRPAATRPKPFTRGPQSAVVVGPTGYPVWTDGYGRIKVRFLWDHSSRKDPDCSGWIRVASHWAGNARGAVSLPRVGDEVLIDFIGGDPDLPICVGSLHNNRRPPPWEMPGEHALSGLRSRELPNDSHCYFDGRSNHLLFDDTRGAIQAQLRSDHLHSQLSLGRIRRVETHKGRRDQRGEGFELRSDGHGVLRAGAGLLLSTHPRQAAAGAMKEIPESNELLARAQEQLQSQARAGMELRAQDEQDQQAVADRIATQNAGLRGAAGQALGKFQSPHLLAASSAGIAMAASQDLHLAAGEHIALSSSGHTSITSAASLLASAARAIRLVAHKGMRLFAARGDLEVQAQAGDLRLSAKHTAALSSTDGWIDITAREGIRLSVGGSCVEITAAQIALLTEGRVASHAAEHRMAGPRSRAAHLNTMPATAFDDRYRLRNRQGDILKNHGWRAIREDGSELSGTSDADGLIEIQRGDAPARWIFQPD